MRRWRSFWADEAGGPAAEFALVLPLILLFLLGTIDTGRYVWAVNQAEKATQTGARWAAVTDLIPRGLNTYSFAVSGGIPAGTQVPQASFPDVTCQSNGTPSCSSFGPADPLAFNAMVTRMSQIKSDIAATNVVVVYQWSGLGFAGDPNGADVVPIISVRLRNMQFRPITFLLFNGNIALPDFSYSLTMEDGSGETSN